MWLGGGHEIWRGDVLWEKLECFLFVFFPCSLGMKQRSNVISYVTVNDSPDSDSSLNSPYATDPLSSLRSTGGALELPSRGAADSSNSRTIIVPPLKTQLNDCIVATQASGRYALIARCAQWFLPGLRCWAWMLSHSWQLCPHSF